MVTSASSPFVTEPTVRVLAGPISPLGPTGPSGPCIPLSPCIP